MHGEVVRRDASSQLNGDKGRSVTTTANGSLRSAARGVCRFPEGSFKSQV